MEEPDRDGDPAERPGRSAGRGPRHRGADPQRPDFPALRAADAGTLGELDGRLVDCRACPRLVAWREEVARRGRPAFRGESYWARPVPGFGPPDARLLVVGLAPAAHGANRTGRMFTGDRSGDVLYAALHDVGLASRGVSQHSGDGLELHGVRITSPVRCAPPGNRPTPGERDTCRPWLVRELRLLAPTLGAVVVLGAFGWSAVLPALAATGWSVPRPRPAFGHGVRVTLAAGEGTPGTEEGTAPEDGAPVPGGLHLFGCYHVSQRNTFTGRLTPAMLRQVLESAGRAAGL